MHSNGQGWRSAIRLLGYFIACLLISGFLLRPTFASADTEVGAIPGSFAVSNGVATYSIPIKVQPGAAGLAPHLALAYNSALGNGLAGYGWSLQGLSAITVCSPTWAQSSVNADVSFSTSSPNRYCLDGMRLFHNTSSAPYRKEIDDFSSTTPYNSGGAGPVPTDGPQYFTVQTSDGLTYTYGKTADSEVLAVGPGIVAGTSMVRVWALNSVSDKYGNSIDYTYQQDTTNGDYWPVSITFTDHNGVAGTHSIVFRYSTLSNGLRWTSYLAGAIISQTKLLNEIDMDENGVQQFVYTLGYENTLTDPNGNTGTDRTRLISVQECAGSTCLPQTTISWQNGTSGWASPQAADMGTHSIPDAAHAGVMQFVDLNGDGLPDILYPGSTQWLVMINNGNGFNTPTPTGYSVDPTYYQDILIVDINGDGNQELLTPGVNSSGQLDWILVTPQWSGNSLSFHSSDTGRRAVGYGGNATIMDMNGDGLQDIVFSDGTNLRWNQNMGGSFASAVTVVAGEFSDGGGSGVVQYQHGFAGATPDFDGTGRGSYMMYSEISGGPGCNPDSCNQPPPPTPVWTLMEGGGYNKSPVSVSGVAGSNGNLMMPLFVDFNGDGLSDVLYADGTAVDGSNWTWQRYLMTGVSLFGGNTSFAWDSSVMSDAIAVDWSGNGRQQVLLALGNSSGACTSLGLVGYENGHFQGGESIGLSNDGPCSSGYYQGSFRTADLRGTGLQDLIWVSDGTVYYAFHRGAHPDLVTTISNHFNQTYNIVYKSLINGASYTVGPGSNATLSFTGEGGNVSAPETRNIVGPMYVVDNYTANDGVGRTHQVTEAYTGAMSDVLGHGFLGFASITSTDTYTTELTAPVTITSVANYDQLFPLNGRVASSTVSVNGNVEQSMSATWTSVASQPDSVYVYASNSQTSTYALGASTPYLTTSTVTTPTLSGSPDYVISSVDTITTTSPSSVQTESVTNFASDDTNWCFSLPTTASVTNTDQTSGVALSRTVTYTNDTAHCQASSSTESVVDNGVTQSLQTTATYDTSYGVLKGRTVTATNAGTPTTYSTLYGYDPSNTFITSATNALQQTYSSVWDPVLGVKKSTTDPNNVGSSFTYDAFGLLLTAEAGDGTSMARTYCLPANGCTPSSGAYSVAVTHYSSTGIAGATMTAAFDSFFRPVHQSTFVIGNSETDVDTAYDSLGRTISVSTPYIGAPTSYSVTTYDLFNRPSIIYTPAGQESGCSAALPSPYVGEACTTTNQYNLGAGFTTETTDPAGKVSSAELNPAGELIAETDAVGTSDQAETQYSYDPFGNLIQSIDANGNVTTMAYDTWGRKLSMTDPNMGQWTYAYDPRGLVQSQTDAKGQVLTMNYDALGRVTSRTIPVGAGTGTDTWTYDGPGGTPTAPFIGKPYGLSGADGYGRQYQYDGAGRPIEVDTTIGGNTYATDTSYDNFGRLAAITYPTTPLPDSDDPPVADAGINQSAVAGQTVNLSGANSSDPDNGPQALTYTWAELAPPSPTEIAAVDGATTSAVSFSTTVAGVYDFQLTVSDSELTSNALVTVTVAPAQVASLTVSAVDPDTGDISLNWPATTGAVNFKMEQSTDGGATFTTLPQSYATNSASLPDYAEGSYVFAVQGCDATGTICGHFSPPVDVTLLRTPAIPAKPTLSPTTTTSGSFTVNWAQPAGTVTSYRLYTSTDGSNYATSNVGNVTSKSFTKTVNGKYYFEVAACNSVSCSGSSNAAVETVKKPVPAAPSLNATANGIAWTPNGSVSATSWDVSDGTTYGASVRSATKTPKITVQYQVAGCNAAGCGNWSNTVTVEGSGFGGGGNNLESQQITPVPAPTTVSAPASGTGSPTASVAIPAAGTAPDAVPLSPHGLARSAALPSLAVVQKPVVVPAAKPPEGSIGSELTVLRRGVLKREDLRMLAAQQRFTDRLRPDAATSLAHDRSTLFAAEVLDETPAGPRVRSVQSATAAGAIDARGSRARPRLIGTTQNYTVNYVYDGHENLIEVVDAANPDLVYWQANSSDAFGHVTAATYANGVITARVFDPNTGMLQAESAGTGGTTGVLNQVYTWDADGNLSTRQDLNAGLTETISYDGLNRIKQAVTSGGASGSLTVSYDAVGNILSKSDVGTYAYSALHPMQIDHITPASGPGRTFAYDNSSGNPGNGNLMSDGVHSYTWDALNRPIQIANGATGATQQFAYTPDGSRYQESTTSASGNTSLTEVNGLFQVYTGTDGHTYDRENIMSSDGAVAIRTVREDGILTTRYMTSDHLGSTNAITDEAGHLDSTESYDAFGQRRDPSNWQSYTCGTAPDHSATTDQGYTGQQDLNDLCLVHMNGRVYDPQVGRMVSADPTIPDPMYSQAFNRYAYVYNNPLNSTDPSGFAPDLGISANDPEFNQDGTPKGSWSVKATVSGSGNQFPNEPLQVPNGTGSQANNSAQQSAPPAEMGPSAPAPTVAPTEAMTGGQVLPMVESPALGTLLPPAPPVLVGPGQVGLDGDLNFATDCAGLTACSGAGGFDQVQSLGDIDWGSLGPTSLPNKHAFEEIPSPSPNLGSGPTAPQNRGTAPKSSCQAATAASCFDIVESINDYREYIAAGLSGVSLNMVRNDQWKTLTGVWKPLASNYFGNQYEGSKLAIKAGAETLEGAALKLDIVGAVVSGALAIDDFAEGDKFGGSLHLLDTAMGVATMLGGLPGLVGGLSYSLVRESGLGDYLGSHIADLASYDTTPYGSH